MNIEVVRNILTPYLEGKELFIYSLKLKKEYGMKILEVLLDSEGVVDIDELAVINSYLAEQLDAYDQDWEEYMLEVSSAGAEKELHSLEQVIKYIDSYVYLEVEGSNYEGKLQNVVDNVLEVKVNLKGRMKIYKINYEEIIYIRLAVHI
ncbi:MAG: hypothetical protein R3Y60_04200 [bacterium]